MLPSGSALKYENRIGWGVSFLTNVGALRRPKRGHYQITDAGKQLIELFPNGAKERDIKALGADPSSPIREYVATTTRKTSAPAMTAPTEESSLQASSSRRLSISCCQWATAAPPGPAASPSSATTEA